MAKDEGKPKAEKRDPVYTVVEVAPGGVLRVIDPARTAKTQEAATDAVWAERPADKKKVHLAAFLAHSFRSTEYDAEEVVVPKKERRGPGIPKPPTALRTEGPPPE